MTPMTRARAAIAASSSPSSTTSMSGSIAQDARRVSQLDEPRPADDARDEEDGVGAAVARLLDLPLVDHELLGQKRDRRAARHRVYARQAARSPHDPSKNRSSHRTLTIAAPASA